MTAAVEAALRRVAETEPDLRAWVLVDADGAREAASRAAAGPLHDVPFGVKDIIDVAGLPTGCGSPLRRGRIASADAWLVSKLRAAGGVPLGKTVTTEFAYFQPGPTRNPHDLGRTPGGSSSGSAAAVAAGVVPLALGTQTAGSLTRPASYCGVAGYVAPAGFWPMTGITGLSPTLDAPGLLAPDVGALAAAIEAVDGTVIAPAPSPKVLLWPGTELSDVDLAMLDALEHTGQALADAGARVASLGDRAGTPMLAEAHATIMAYEAARSLAAEAKHPEALSAQLNELLHQGRNTSDAAHDRALAIRDRARTWQRDLLDRADAILGPAAPGPAPHGLDATGSPVLSRPWQLLGLPVVTVPGHRDPDGMPLGLQLIGHPGRAGRLLGIASHTQELVRDLAGGSR